MNLVKLTDVCNFQGGSQPPKSTWIKEKRDGYIPMLQIRDFTQGEKGEYVPYSKTLKTCNEDDVLIARYGASVGKILTGLSGAYNVAIMKTIPNESILDKSFLHLYLLSPYFQHRITNLGSRAAQQGFNKEELAKLNIPLPTLPTQRKIVSVLDKAQLLIDMRKQQIELLDNLIQSTFYDMFGDPVKNDMGWEMKPFENGIRNIKYGTSTPPIFSDSGIPFVRATNIKKGYIVDNDMKFISEEEASKIEKCKLNFGDIIIVRSGANTGDATYINSQYINCYGGYDLIVSLSNTLNYCYINWLLNSIYRKIVINPLTRRAGQPHLNANQVKGMMICYPSMELQNQFAQKVEKIEQQKALLNQSLKLMENNFNSLMQRAFRGEIV